MKLNADVEIVERDQYGVVLICRNIEVADQLEDFLTEKCFVLFKTKMEPQEVSFFFGLASSASKVKEIYERFEAEIHRA